MRARGLGDPILVAPRRAGRHQGDQTCFPRSARQRCLAHRMRNLAAKVPEDQWPESRPASGRLPGAETAIARNSPPGSPPTTVVTCRRRSLLRGRFEACIAHLRMPVTHRRAIGREPPRTALPRGAGRLEVAPNAFGERPVLKLMFGAMIRAADRWRAIKFTDFERRQISPPSERTSTRSMGAGIRHPGPPVSAEKHRPAFPAALGLDRHALWPRASLAARDGAAHGVSAAAQKRRVTSTGSFLGSASGLGVAVSSAMPQIGHEPDPSATFGGDAGSAAPGSAGMRGSATPVSVHMRRSAEPRSAGMRGSPAPRSAGYSVF